MPALRTLLLALATLAAGAREPGVGWDGFPAFVWRLDHAGRPAPAALIAPFAGTNVEGDEPAAWALERGLDVYVGHAPGREELYLERDRPWYDALWRRYYEDRDAARLVREPCLSEAGTFEALAARLARSLAARGGATGLAVSLGDEVGLTPWGDPLDLCASAACRAAWARWLPAELDRLGLERAVEDVPFVSTDDARRAWAAGDESLLGPWLLRRRFHQEVVLELLERLAARARELSPGSPVALMGLSGRTAFGGVAVERALGFLDVLEPYATGDARELAFTLRGDGQRVLRTVFPDEGSARGGAWQAWEHFLRGGDGLVLWSDRELARQPGYHAELARAVTGIRRLRAELGAWRPAPAGLALVHSPDSLALSWLREALRDGPTWPRRFAGYHEEHGDRERALRAWLRLAEDVGLLPGSLPLDALGADTAARFPLLVASHVLVLDPAEERRLAAYLESGGHLLVHGPFAQYDAAGRARGGDALARLGPRAARLPAYVSRRLDADSVLDAPGTTSDWAALVSWLRAAARDAGAPFPPARVGADGLPRGFLTAGRREPDGSWTLLLLPNLAARADRLDERGLMRPLELELELEEGWTAEWSHPLDGVLPPGEAGVVRLRRDGIGQKNR